MRTTDVETSERHIEPKIIEDDIVFILNNVEKYLSKKPQKKDIKSVFCGLRPLISHSNEQTKTKELSREHIIYETRDGVLHVLGGKWTTYRLMGCLLYTSPSPRDKRQSRMPSSA